MTLSCCWLVALVFAVAACQAAPPPPRPSAKDPGILAAEALEKGDYARAADLYRNALAAAPESLPLHYGLGVSASHLERREEAIREFRWVLERGQPTSDEVRAARRWLQTVGALPRTATVASAAAPEEPQEPAQKPATASVRGRATFGENPGDVVAMERMQLFLYDHPNRVTYFRIRTDEQGRFQFTNVPPGIYKLTDRAAGPPRWRLRVEIKPGQDVTLDLNPGNSTRVHDDFPESTPPTGARQS
jgi:tetratricopeptide (TPR) repeat protein